MDIIKKIIEFIKSLLGKSNEEQVVMVENKQTESYNNVEKTDELIKIEDEIMEQEKIFEGEAFAPTEKKKNYNGLVVILDPGHAISTSGKKSPFSLKKVSSPELPFEEWNFNREITYMLKPLLKEYGIDVFVTTDAMRDETTDLGLSKRAARGNDYVKKSGKKGLFISIHSDADGMGDKWTSAHGWSCFTTKGQNNSDKFADCLYDAAEKILKPMGITIRTDRKDGDRDWEQDFTVILKSNMPAVLTENLFYTNIDDLRFLNSDEGKNAIVQVHLKGILKFADTIYKM